MKRIHEFVGLPVPDHLQLFQLTDETDVPSCHIYMEAQIFTSDSRRLVLHRSAHPHGSEQHDPKHQYLLCDLADNGKLVPLTHETGATAPVLSPNSKYFYYFINELTDDGGLIRLMRRALDGSDRREIAVAEGGALYMYPLSTISSDGKRIAAATALKLGKEHYPDHGLWIFDLEKESGEIILRGPDYCNLHMQYCRSPEHPHDIMIQRNHGCRRRDYKDTIESAAAFDAASGFKMRKYPFSDDPNANGTGYGLEIKLLNDLTGEIKSFPWGRDGVEFCQGHQCWRGESNYAVASTLNFSAPSKEHCIQELIEARAGEPKRNILSRDIERPHFLHFATDRAGRKIVSDYEAENNEWHLYCGSLGESPKDPADLRFILNLGSRQQSPWHPHPFLSPHGKMIFFNSSADGQLQAYCLYL